MQTHYTWFLTGAFAKQRKVSHGRRVGQGDGQTAHEHSFQAEGTTAQR